MSAAKSTSSDPAGNDENQDRPAVGLKSKRFLHQVWLKLPTGFAAILAIVGAGAAFWFVFTLIDSRIEDAIRDPDFVNRLRPSVTVFNQEGAILYQLGEPGLITNIEVSSETYLPSVITITPSRYLAAEPLLTAIGGDVFEVSAKRGRLYSWVFELQYVVDNSNNDEARRFRLEVFD